jgi:hypothetical protein
MNSAVMDRHCSFVRLPAVSGGSSIFDDKRTIDGKNMSMNSQSLGLRVASIIFGIMCLIHLWRLLFAHFTVQVGSHQLPTWGSGVAVIVTGGLSIWMFRLSSNRGS